MTAVTSNSKMKITLPIYEEGQSVLREWSADQPAKAIHVEGILLVV